VGDGRIQGRVIDRTAPAHPLGHQVVRLTIIERGASSEQQAVSDATGAFHFSALPVGGIRVFILSTDYRGVRYTSDRLVLLPDTPARTADLVVYEPSMDRLAVRAAIAFAVVDVAPGALRVSVVQRFENPTDRTVVIDPQDPLAFPLPPRAQSVQFLAGWRDPKWDGGRITDAFPLYPGGVQVAYSYGLEVPRSRIALPWALPYGAAEVEMLVADAGVRTSGDGLQAQGTIAVSGRRYLRWTGGPIAPGGQVALRFDDVPVARDPWPAAVATGLALTLGTGLALALRRSANTRVSEDR
jgi:hypothetical protein